MKDDFASSLIRLLATRRRATNSSLSHLMYQNKNLESRESFQKLPWEVFKNCHILQGRKSNEAHLSSVDDGLGTEVDPVDPSCLAHLGQIREVRGGRGNQQVSCS